MLLEYAKAAFQDGCAAFRWPHLFAYLDCVLRGYIAYCVPLLRIACLYCVPLLRVIN